MKGAPGAFFGLLVVGIGLVTFIVWLGMEWRYRAQIENKDATIELLTARAARENDFTREAYRLTSEQWARFIETAKVPPGQAYRVFIFYNGSCEECAILAQHLFDRLALISGWTFNGGAGMPDPLQSGLLVQVHSKSNVTDEAIAIARALQAAGLNAVITEEPALGEDAAPQLFIGIPQ